MLTSSRGLRDWKDYLAQDINLSWSQPVRMRPLLGDKFVRISLTDWWSGEPVFVHHGKQFTRKNICLSAVNKDGGAHVDDTLEPYYTALAGGENMFGITGNLEYGENEPPFAQSVLIYPNNGHLALIRQFAHEFLRSAEHFNWL